jgi:hypothetical protein
LQAGPESLQKAADRHKTLTVGNLIADTNARLGKLSQGSGGAHEETVCPLVVDSAFDGR